MKYTDRDIHNAIYDGDFALVNIILDEGYDINKVDKYGFTPVMTAVLYGKIGILKALVEKGASLTVPDSNGWEDLYDLVWRQYEEMCQTLRKLGAERKGLQVEMDDDPSTKPNRWKTVDVKTKIKED